MEMQTYADIVRVKHPRVWLTFKALRFVWEGKNYYAIPHNVGAGRMAFGEADGIEVVEESSGCVSISRDYARAVVGVVEATVFFEDQTRLFLEPRRDWFRNPDPPPAMPRTPDLEELYRLGLI